MWIILAKEVPAFNSAHGNDHTMFDRSLFEVLQDANTPQHLNPGNG